MQPVESMLGVMDGAVLERLAKIMGYMKTAAGTKGKKLKKREKLRMLAGDSALATPSGSGERRLQSKAYRPGQIRKRGRRRKGGWAALFNTAARMLGVPSMLLFVQRTCSRNFIKIWSAGRSGCAESIEGMLCHCHQPFAGLPPPLQAQARSYTVG